MIFFLRWYPIPGLVKKDVHELSLRSKLQGTGDKRSPVNHNPWPKRLLIVKIVELSLSRVQLN